MVRESRIVAGLLLNEVNQQEWAHAIQVDNVLQKRSTASARRIAQAIRKRLERLEPEFLRALNDGDEELATQVAFCAALARNLLLVEFMERVVRDAFVTQVEKLQLFQWSDFLDDCAHRDSTIIDWQATSRKKMGQVVFRMLAEMGYVNNPRSLKLQNVIVRPEIKALLEASDRHRIKKCMEVSYTGES